MAARTLDIDSAWELVLSAVNRSNVTLPLPGTDKEAVKLNGHGAWHLMQPATGEAKDLLSVFLPLCRPVPEDGSPKVIGQLGQSLDGRIATVTGRSRFINGDDGITHLHRIRAVSDAVIVGAGTASTDNPRLTVRRTSGRNPVRVVIDRHHRVPDSHHLFTDGEAPTLRLVAGTYDKAENPSIGSGVTEIPCLGDAESEDAVDPRVILEVLADLGLNKVGIRISWLIFSLACNHRLHFPNGKTGWRGLEQMRKDCGTREFIAHPSVYLERSLSANLSDVPLTADNTRMEFST